jgi:hypothetical protein
MKKLLLFLFFIPALVRSQTANIATLPIFTGNLDSAKVVGSINGLSKNFWGVDLKRGLVRYTDTASMFSGYLRLSALAPYLLASTAASTYQPLGNYATPSQVALKLNYTDTGSMLTNYRHWLAGYLTSTTGDARYYTKTLADARYLQSETDPHRLLYFTITGTNTKTLVGTLADSTKVSIAWTDLQGTGGGSFTFTGTASQYVAGDGSYITFPTIPTTTNQLTNNSGFITSSALSPYLTSATAASTYATQSALTTTNSNVTTNTTAIGTLSSLTDNRYYDVATAGVGAFQLIKPNGLRDTISGIGGTDTTYLRRDINANTTAIASKQNLITLTTTGTSGAATFNQSTGALNIPSYTGGTGGTGGDMLSTLVNTEISVTGATTATIGTMHVCSGTSADYTVTLPAASGNAGKLIGFRMASGLTKLVTLDGNASETIDGALTRIMWANETAILYCDGTTWTKISGKSIPMFCTMSRNTSLSIAASTVTRVPLNNTLFDNSGRLADLTNTRINIQRPGYYDIDAMLTYNNMTGNVNTQVQLYKNGTLLKNIGVTVNTGAYPSPTITHLASCSASDYLEIYAYHVSSVTEALYVATPVNTLTIKEVPTW